MRFEVELPFEYTKRLQEQAPIGTDGRITERTSVGIENTLYLYSKLAKRHAKAKENNPINFRIEEIYLVGSGARENKIKSDLDLLLIAPSIDEESGNELKTIMSYVLFCDRPKQEAIDVYIRPYDKYPSRASIKITEQIEYIIQKYNENLKD